MTSVTSSSTYGYSNLAYARSANSDAVSNGGTASTPAASTQSSATNVTLSDHARALLAAQSGEKDFATVTADARATLDGLYKASNVTVPLAGDKPTIDLTGLDRRTLFAIATNSAGKFTEAEQTVAARELQRRFDAALGPPAAATQLVGDNSVLYKAAIAYFDGMSAEEKATDGWAKQRAALTQGYEAAQLRPEVLPAGIANDPIPDFVKRAGQITTAPDSGSAAQTVRLVLDQQYDAAAKKGSELVFDPQRRSGQLVDFSGLDNRTLSAAALNQDNLFSAEEVRAAKREIDTRTRMSFLQAFQQAGSSGDPRAFSLGLIQQYQGMSAEERQVANLSPSFVDLAVKNYKSTSSLLSMFTQGTGGTSLL
jgi:hypothetical protein